MNSNSQKQDGVGAAKEIVELVKNQRSLSAKGIDRDEISLRWKIGRIIDSHRKTFVWGSNTLKAISDYLNKELPEERWCCTRNLRYMTSFYQLYPNAVNMDTLDRENKDVVGLGIPWGHHRVIIDNCGDDSEKAIYYVYHTQKNNWNRDVLLKHIKDNDFEKWQDSLNEEISHEIEMKKSKVKQRKIRGVVKNVLLDKLQDYLMDHNEGIKLVGKDKYITINHKDKCVDRILYNTRDRRYINIRLFFGCDYNKIEETKQISAKLNKKFEAKSNKPSVGIMIFRKPYPFAAEVWYTYSYDNEALTAEKYWEADFDNMKFPGMPSIGEVKNLMSPEYPYEDDDIAEKECPKHGIALT